MPTELPGLERTLRPDEAKRMSEPSPVVEPLEAESPSEHAQRGEILRISAEQASGDSGDFEAALEEIELALKNNSKDAHALAIKGRIFWAREQRDEAVEFLQEAVELNPKLDWALTDLTDLLCELKRYTEAEELLSRLLTIGKNDPLILGVYGKLLRQEGRLGEAEERLEKAAELTPSLAWPHAQLGEVFRLQGRSGSALRSFKEAERLAEAKSLTHNVIAWILIRQGLVLSGARRYGDAVKALTRALRLAPNEPSGVRLKAHVLFESGKREECFEFLRNVIMAGQEPTWAYTELAHYAERMGLYEEAMEVVDVCLEEFPNSRDFLIRKGVLLHRVGRFKDSADTLKEAHERHGDSWLALGQRASALKYLKYVGRDDDDEETHTEEALSAITEALELTDKQPMLWSTRGDIRRAEGDMAGAEQDYRRAVELLDERIKKRPQSIDAPTMWLMGWCSLWLGEDDLAFRLLAHAKSLRPDLHMIRFVLALALFTRNETHQAESELEAALKAVRGTSSALRCGILTASVYAFQVVVNEPTLKASRNTVDALKQIKSALQEAKSEAEQKRPDTGRFVPKPSTHGERDSLPTVTQRLAPLSPLDLTARPAADPMMPMIRLDSGFKIIEWNSAADLVFDHTLDGRRSHWIGDWIGKHLDDPLVAATHGKKVFLKDPTNPPLIDVEDLHYTSDRYGPIKLKKRAFYIPNDDNKTQLGWLMIFEPRFKHQAMSFMYRKELIHGLKDEIKWTEHALSYDAVLSNTSVYEELLATVTGQKGPLSEVPANARVLDVGCGTGNLTHRLVTTVTSSVSTPLTTTMLC